LWKSELPLKLKVWLWLICHNAIATKDNMKKELGWKNCRFCPADETISHLFYLTFLASIYMWNIISFMLDGFDMPTIFTQYFWWINSSVGD
jgi:hypothetical protein